MERLVRLAAVLWAAGRVRVETDRLIEIGGCEAATAKDLKTQLLRDLRYLERQGWQIECVAEADLAGVGARGPVRLGAAAECAGVELEEPR
jgi:hypothetical protein